MTDHPKMPDEIWAIVHCGAHGWTTSEEIAKYAMQSQKYVRADNPAPAPVAEDVRDMLKKLEALIEYRKSLIYNNFNASSFIPVEIVDLETLIQSAAREAGYLARIEELEKKNKCGIAENYRLHVENETKLAAADGLKVALEKMINFWDGDLSLKEFAPIEARKALASYTSATGEVINIGGGEP